MNSLFIALENDEWCHFQVRIGSLALVSIYCVWFVSFYFFLFFLIFLWILLLLVFKKSFSILKSIGVVPRFLSGVSRGELLQYYLVINVTGLVQFGKNLNYILPPLVSYNYLQQSISVKLIYQFLYLINGYLFFTCLEKAS